MLVNERLTFNTPQLRYILTEVARNRVPGHQALEEGRNYMTPEKSRSEPVANHAHQGSEDLDLSANSLQGDLMKFEKVRLELLQTLSGPHRVSRSMAPEQYPPRRISPEQSAFDLPGYSPVFFADPKVYANPAGLPDWAEPLPSDPVERENYLQSLPRNPGGPTGIYGPGKLGKPLNCAADIILLSVNPEDGAIYQVQIRRKNGQWATPGGMIDAGETPLEAALREFEEETGVKLSGVVPRQIYSGYADDYRNTDTHFMHTTAFIASVSWQEASLMRFAPADLSEGILELGWRKLNSENVQDLFGCHPELVKLGVIEFITKLEPEQISTELRSQALQSARGILGLE